MRFAELSADQRRQRIDAVQAFEVWHAADREFKHSYRGTMHWRKVGAHQYLARKFAQVWTQIGKRSKETERIKMDYTNQRTDLRANLTKLEKNLASMDRVTKAMNLGRVPDIAARVLRKLDDADMLGSHVVVAGTHCLYAYEVRAGIFFQGELTSTKDIDFLFDVRQRFTFIMRDARERGFIGLLKQVDSSFKKFRTYNATNSDAYAVDIIRPPHPREASHRAKEISLNPGDLEPAPIEGLQWLINAPRFEEVVIGEDGRPLRVVCVDPRAFALHKLWMSRQDSRKPEQRKRDAMQAAAVAFVVREYLGMKFDRKELAALPKELLDGIETLTKPIVEPKQKKSKSKKA